LLRDINPSMNPFFTDLGTVGNQVFFFASDSVYNLTFWASDGTPNGTREVKEINPGPNADWWSFHHSVNASMISMRDTAYFFAYRNDIGYELWKSAGHDSNTVLVKDINPGPASALPTTNLVVQIQPTLFQNKLYFVAFSADLGYEVWRTDGTAEGTIPVSAIPGNSDDFYPTYLQVVGERLFFAMDPWGTPQPGAFFASDGTPEGTIQFSNLIPAHYPPLGSLFFPQVGEWIYFTARETGDGNNELYRVKEDLSVVELFYDFNGDNEGNPENFTQANGGFIFNTRHNNIGNADNITLLCNGSIDINQSLLNENGAPMEATGGWIGWNNRALIEASNDSLYITDGTVAGLRSLGLMGEINGLNAEGMERYFIAYNEYLIFIFSDDDYTYLMISDGTAQGTFPLLNPENWSPLNRMTVLGNKLIISLIDELADPAYPELYALNLNDLPLLKGPDLDVTPQTLVYPNPVEGKFKIANMKSHHAFKIFSSHGLLMQEGHISQGEEIILDRHIKEGVYTIICNQIENGNQFTSRFLVVH